jgi:hypothetical protein
VAARLTHHPRKRRLAALARSVHEDDRAIRQRLGKARLDEPGVEAIGGHSSYRKIRIV